MDRLYHVEGPPVKEIKRAYQLTVPPNNRGTVYPPDGSEHCSAGETITLKSTKGKVFRCRTPLTPLLSIFVCKLSVYPEELAALVLDADQAAEAISLVFCF